MLFNLDFANNTILSCFFFFFLVIDLYFLIPAVIPQIFNSIAELVISFGTPKKEAKTEIGIHSANTCNESAFKILAYSNRTFTCSNYAFTC